MANNIDNSNVSNILASVIRKFKDREAKGLVKYNATMDRDDLTTLEWLTHLEEELMDGVLYIAAAKQKVKDLEEDYAILEQELTDVELELEEIYDCLECDEYEEDEECCYGNKITRFPGAEFRSPCTMHDEVSEEEIMLELEGSILSDLAEIEREKRMNIIGQNGNDGLHYGTEEDGTGYVDYPRDGVEVAVDKSRPCGWDNTQIPTSAHTTTRRVYPDAYITTTTFNYGNKETE